MAAEVRQMTTVRERCSGAAAYQAYPLIPSPPGDQASKLVVQINRQGEYKACMVDTKHAWASPKCGYRMNGSECQNTVTDDQPSRTLVIKGDRGSGTPGYSKKEEKEKEKKRGGKHGTTRRRGSSDPRGCYYEPNHRGISIGAGNKACLRA